MDELTAVFGTKEEAQAYAKGLAAGLELEDSGFSYSVEVTEQFTGEWQVTADYVY